MYRHDHVLEDCLGESTEAIHIIHMIIIDKQSELKVMHSRLLLFHQLFESEYCRIWHFVCPLGLVLCQNTHFVTQKPEILDKGNPIFLRKICILLA